MDKKSPASIEEAEKKRKEDEESKWDLIYMVTAVLGTVVIITFFMVSLFLAVGASSLCKTLTIRQLFVAWMAGARFDIAYYEFKQQFGELVGFAKGVPAQVTEVHVNSGHSEL